MKSLSNKIRGLHVSGPMKNLRVKLLFVTCLCLAITAKSQIQVGAADTSSYLYMLKGKRVAVVANPTSMVGDEHLITFLMNRKVQLQQIFALEHGIYGNADAGAQIKDGVDERSGLPVFSLYGSNKKPKPDQLENIDIVVFDIQDVGARFYTYISSLHYIMEACAELGVQLVVLDRPNPNANIVDGPVLEEEQKSFVGMHRIPVLHGMTIGEYALMINGEGWTDSTEPCSLTVVACKGYKRGMRYDLPVPPSPNLPNAQAVFLYAHLCLFEGTNVSVGRGTDMPFQVFGSPYINVGSGGYAFVPKPSYGAAKPKHQGKTCKGYDLSDIPLNSFSEFKLSYLIQAYESSSNKSKFFNSFFERLAGTTALRKQIEEGMSEDDIRATWQKDLDEFKRLRQQYLLYPELE